MARGTPPASLTRSTLARFVRSAVALGVAPEWRAARLPPLKSIGSMSHHMQIHTRHTANVDVMERTSDDVDERMGMRVLGMCVVYEHACGLG